MKDNSCVNYGTVVTGADTPKLPLVSVIIPVYNYGHFIGDTLKSVCAQTYRHWECIVVDDGSSDNTKEVVSAFSNYDSRFKYVHQRNQGVSAARNTGLRLMKGDYVQFLDGDDLLEERKLERHLTFLSQNHEIDIVYGSVRYFRSDRVDERRYSMWDPDSPWMPEVSGSGREVVEYLLRDNIMVVSAPLLKRNVIDRVSEFDMSLSILQDWDYWLRAAIEGARFQYLDCLGTMALVRWHPNSISQNPEGLIRESVKLRKKYLRIINDADTAKLHRSLTVNFMKSMGLEMHGRGAKVKGSRYFYEAGLASSQLRDKMRWFLCAFLAPLIPGDRIGAFIESLWSIKTRYQPYFKWPNS